MTLRQLLDPYIPPEWFLNLFLANFFIWFLACGLVMLHSDGMVTVQFLDSSFNFEKSIPMYTNDPVNLTLINITVPKVALHRYFDDEKASVLFVHKFLLWLFYCLWPLFNLVYCLIILLDGTVSSPKDLYTLIFYRLRGVQR